MTIPRRKPYFIPGLIPKLVKFEFSKNKIQELAKLENDLSNILKIPNPLVVESGRIGLYLILKASGLKAGLEIVMPGLTFGLMKNVIEASGFKAIPVDCDPKSFQMSPSEVEKAISKRTGAILATHIFGNACDIKKLKAIADKHELMLIEDCAESLGATVDGKPTGTFGDVAFSSFNIAKPLQGISGGVIFGRNKGLLKKIRSEFEKTAKPSSISARELTRSIGGYFLLQTILWPILMYLISFERIQKLFVSFYRSIENTHMVVKHMSPLYAHIVRSNIPSFKQRMSKRRKIIKIYTHKLPTYLKAQNIFDKTCGNGYMAVFNYTFDTMKLRRYLALYGIDVAIKREVADDCIGKVGSNTDQLINHLISLPIYETLSINEIRRICTIISTYKTPQYI